MPLPRSLPLVLYATALSSLSIQLLGQRKLEDAERAQIKAQTSILESLAADLRAGKPMHDEEIDRQLRLARTANKTDTQHTLRWKEAFFGPKRSRDDHGLSEWDKRDLALLRKELESEK